MALARTHSVALVGVAGHLIEVEADIAQGLPMTILIGLPDTALREARDRIRAAIINSGESWPQQKITVGLSPASLPKRGSGFDLAIAIAIMAANHALPLSAPAGKMFLAELGLDGRLRPVPGVLPAVVTAEPCVDTVVVAAENAAEARLVPGVRVVGAGSLAEVAIWLRGGPAPTPPPSPAPSPRPLGPGGKPVKARVVLDLADVLGQSEARMAAEICAAGGHNLSLLGPPGAGKTMLAERLPTILPRLDAAAALEVTSIHSVAGTLAPGTGLVSEPPFCAPHHTASKAAIVGGGSGLIRPGAASLAHRGVLFLDEAPEFGRDVLDALRQPLEAGEVVIARQAMTARFPARFTLVLAANPCPCARAATPGGAACECSPAARRRYLGRLSGPLLDRVDVKITLEPVNRREMLYDREYAETSAVVAGRVAAARDRAARRLAGTPWRLNAEIPGAELRRAFPPEQGALKSLDRAMELGQVSARGADKIVRVAWSVADLAGRPRPGAGEIDVAIALWLGVAK
jgi:magnesium chelatase family protein